MQTTIPLQLLSIKDEGYHIFINMSIHGQLVRMLVDTGASRTVFDSDALKNIDSGIELEENEDKATGLGSSTVENFIGVIKEIKIGELTINNYQIGVLDLAHVNVSYNIMEMPAIAGVLGSDILVNYNAVIDFAKQEMVLNWD